ncbi:MAG: bifunctional [glutamine synthetase] adenylyltransferase/[glutamine synthetase]-adenylyl-L-tyrosine phosphorylase [Roseovarius sp.]
MSFSGRITRLPRAYDPDQGAEGAQSVPGQTGDIAALITGAAGCSPYLKQLMTHEGAWLATAFDDVDAALAQEFMRLSAVPADDLPTELRRGKRRIALMTALADLAGVWALHEVTRWLTQFADLACQLALRAAVAREIRRGKLPGMTEDDLSDCAGMFVLAMGKMGAHELNYSSDIDLICLFDEARFQPDDYNEARASFIRATRAMSGMLNDRTADGYVFRTDLRLRPDPQVTPVCMGMAGAEAYYESLGRTWERAAYIKARPCAGDLAAGQRFLDGLRPFVWRKHLDFAAIEDAHNMRLRIREHKGLGGAITLTGHNMKLGRGGIREIEFFTQTRQIIAGGRDPDLRVRGTVEGLATLAQKDWVPAQAAADLTAHYRFHREVEHRLQMLRDAQTHALPGSDAEFDRLACFMGLGVDELKAELRDRLAQVDHLIEGFFAPDDEASPGAEQTSDSSDLTSDLTRDLDRDIISRWPSYPALRSDRASEIFRRLRPDILARLARTAHPNEALLAFDGFLSGLPAGVQVFSMFEANPQLIDLLVDISGTAPELATYLSRHASVFDAVIAGSFFAEWPGPAALGDELHSALRQEPDYETKLITARRWHKEWHFRIGVHFLRGLIPAEEAGRHYADLAEAVLRALWPAVVDQFALRHGPPPGRGAVVLSMGSLGAGRLNARSDLDLIVIYDAPGIDQSDGRRPLATRTYYARLTQAMITALTAQMADGRLYEVDMRLRPSGNQGPVATSLQSFQDYQENEAWIWEHLALTRARAIAGSDALADDIDRFRTTLLGQAHSALDVLREVKDMRTRLLQAKTPEGPLDARRGPGHLQALELTAQTGCLLAGSAARDVPSALLAAQETGWMTAEQARVLTDAYDLCWKTLQTSRLLGDKPIDPSQLGEGGAAFVLRETGFDSITDLQAGLNAATAAASDVITGLLAQTPKGSKDAP